MSWLWCYFCKPKSGLHEQSWLKDEQLFQSIIEKYLFEINFKTGIIQKFYFVQYLHFDFCAFVKYECIIFLIVLYIFFNAEIKNKWKQRKIAVIKLYTCLSGTFFVNNFCSLRSFLWPIFFQFFLIHNAQCYSKLSRIICWHNPHLKLNLVLKIHVDFDSVMFRNSHNFE